MNILKSWPATVVGAVITLLALVALIAIEAGDDYTSVKGFLWVVAILPVVIGVVVDLVRQKKVDLPGV